ncbi:MAG: NifU N-terminal domain-containing protein [Chloroflexi bacterium]|nr:NifU N-terminal domain-containing protein [Chloroflexota bacterium]
MSASPANRRRVAFEPTPNPHALRASVTPPLPEVPGEIAARSFRDSAAAAGHPLAAALFAIPGVVGVLLSSDGSWLSVNKSPEAQWKAASVAVRRVLERWP